MSDNETVIHLDEPQLQAVALCQDTTKRLVSVSGPAGSGKTTIIENTYEAVIGNGARVALAAPTGKAARRIKEATGIPAVTIHKLLEYNRPGERDEKTGEALDVTRPKRDASNRLDYDVVIVDEYAMVNHELHNNLLAALPSGGCLRAFGDLAQLPPIERTQYTDNKGQPLPTPFKKLIEKFDSVTLDKVYRQGEGSGILTEASKIRRGATPTLNQDLGDFYIRISSSPVNAITEFVINSLDDGIDFRQIKNQIIVPGKGSWVGTEKLNGTLRSLLNPSPPSTVTLERHKWVKFPTSVGIGDKVVCTTNTYDMRSFFDRYTSFDDYMMPDFHTFIPCPETKQMLNGETGIILAIEEDVCIEVDFGDRIVEIPWDYEEYWPKNKSIINVSPLKNIDLAYALTTHKCQGSEFERIVYIINKTSQYVQSRQNFYTAITRARNRVDVITDQISIRVSTRKVIS